MPSPFLSLSCALTGFDNLSQQTADLYYNKLKELFPNIDDLITTYQSNISEVSGDHEQNIRQNIWTNQGFKAICQQIIAVWYNASLTDTNGNVTWQAPPEFYFDALLWKAIEAHPPALSGGYFGYWRYAPEN